MFEVHFPVRRPVSGGRAARAGALAAGLALVAAMGAAAPSRSSLPGRIVEPRSGITLIRVPGGTFTMGSPAGEAGRGADETPHRVTLSPFYLGATEVTQAQWARVMGWNHSHHAGCPACPVEEVTYVDVQAFIGRLNAHTRAIRFRLPTEAEWEFACRAGSTTPFSMGASISTSQANFDGDFPYNGAPRGANRRATMPAASFPPNRWGFFDMHGNVWEWTADWYGAYPRNPVHDPAGPASGTLHVIRGGSWAFDANSARCALRYTHAPRLRGYSLGFRLAATASPR